MVQFHSPACGCPVFPTFFIEETVLSPMYILDSFVINLSCVCECVCMYRNVCLFLGSLYAVPLVYVSFMKILYCLDFYSFIIQFEIRTHDIINSVLSQDCFGYLEPFVVPHKF